MLKFPSVGYKSQVYNTFFNFYLALISQINFLQERQRKMAEEQRNLIQDQAQRQAQVLRYEDELARKRLQVLTT